MKFFWEHKIEGEKIEFDNTPFITSKIQKLDCQFGTHYYKQKQESSKWTSSRHPKNRLYSSCLWYTPSPFIQTLSKEKTSDLSCRGLKQKKKEKSCELHKLSSIMKFTLFCLGKRFMAWISWDPWSRIIYTVHTPLIERSTSLWVKAQVKWAMNTCSIVYVLMWILIFNWLSILSYIYWYS